MIKLGITGNIASGKSLIEAFLKEKGVKSIDSDKIVHELLDSDIDTIKEVKELFKPVNILDENGKLSREKIGNIVFKDKEKLHKLEKIIHPKVGLKIRKFFQDNCNDRIVAVAVPLLYESKMESFFDYIILIAADENIRLNRLIKRNSFTLEEAKRRIDSQMPQEEKINKANFVIYNNSDIENAKKQLDEILISLSDKK